ncbi:superoxide dismutase family protein [Noviherbaspirillum massiliense]|uniref:superoxide dismutase family protein n=1 Tax=Noviherbaspirillum massiliense TaxID=1465823 RepID=UPI0003637DFA|nr:superoxide dismutase family protein [Noviherbaspirillum massiliense]
MKLLIALALGTAVLSACANMSKSNPVAVAQLKPTQGSEVSGTTSFTQQGDKLIVKTEVRGLKPGAHGFHVHERGDCSAPDASSAGGHFNPTKEAHGSPTSVPHHGGDLGNLEADASGKAVAEVAIPVGSVNMKKGDPNSVIGRALVVHADPDDYVSQPAGNSGKRVACGVIALQ